MKLTTSVLLCLVAIFISLPSEAQKPSIEHGPWITNVTETGFTVVWTTAEKTFTWLELAPDDGTALSACKRPRFYNTISGRRQAGTVHSIDVTGLEPGRGYRYRIYGKIVTDDSSAYGTAFGPESRMTTSTVKTFSQESEKCSFVMVNDIHGKDETFKALTQDIVPGSIDFFLMNGDMVSYINDRKFFLQHVYDPAAELLASTPLVYARGNHETRGSEAHCFGQYNPTPTDEPYFIFRHGPVAFIVIDAGEDKPDSSPEYSGYADFETYRKSQLEWIKTATKCPEFSNAPLKVAIMHIPALKEKSSYFAQLWVNEHFLPALNDAGIDLMLSGHHHDHIYIQSGQCGNKFPILANDDTDRLEFEASSNGYTIRTVDTEGRITSVYNQNGKVSQDE